MGKSKMILGIIEGLPTMFRCEVALASYERQDDIQLLRFANYFGRPFSGMPALQFPWVNLLRVSPISKVPDNLVSHIPEAVTRRQWIGSTNDLLKPFVLFSFGP
nr:hypothetical protein [Tanacetum cinerariifolium]